MGLESEAVPYYEKAISSGLRDPERSGALLGLGSTYRTLGMYGKSKEIFEQGLREYPRAREFKVFYAMTLYNLRQYDKAMELLLREISDTSNDEGTRSYQRAIAFILISLIRYGNSPHYSNANACWKLNDLVKEALLLLCQGRESASFRFYDGTAFMTL